MVAGKPLRMSKYINNVVVRWAVGGVIGGLLIANPNAITAATSYGFTAHAPTVGAGHVSQAVSLGKSLGENIAVDVLKRIAKCESGGRQFDDKGRVVRGFVNPRDVGLFQINLDSWFEKSQELGYDLFTPEGNIKMALYLYSRNGTRDWNASRHCWDPEYSTRVKAKTANGDPAYVATASDSR